MLELWSSLRESLADPHRVHAMLVHVPVAVSVLLPLLVIALAFVGKRRCGGGLRWTIVALYAMGAVTAWMAKEYGEKSQRGLDVSALAEPALDELEHHEELGEKVPLILAGAAVIVALGAVPFKMARVAVMVVAVIGSLGAAAWVGVTAHHGGRLVYVHGVGVPGTANHVPADSERPSEAPVTAPRSSPAAPTP